MNTPVLECKGAGKKYRGFVLENIDLSLPAGYIMGLVGPNGAGKTTLIRLIMNLIPRDSGTIELFGMDNIRHEEAVKQRIGFVYDTPCWFDDLSLQRNRDIVAPFYEKWNENLFRQLAGEFQLDLKKRFKQLSSGQQRKFSLAMALSHDADLIIMDEPTAGLDPVFRRELITRLADIITAEHKSILLSTHITSDLDRIADYIAFIDRGQLRFSGNMEELRVKWGVVKGARDLLKDGSAHRHLIGVRYNPYGFEALTDDVSAIRRDYGEKVVIEPASLEEVMFHLSRKEEA